MNRQQIYWYFLVSKCPMTSPIPWSAHFCRGRAGEGVFDFNSRVSIYWFFHLNPIFIIYIDSFSCSKTQQGLIARLKILCCYVTVGWYYWPSPKAGPVLKCKGFLFLGVSRWFVGSVHVTFSRNLGKAFAKYCPLSSPKRAECFRGVVIVTLNHSYRIRTYTPYGGIMASFSGAVLVQMILTNYAHSEAEYTDIMPVLLWYLIALIDISFSSQLLAATRRTPMWP